MQAPTFPLRARPMGSYQVRRLTGATERQLRWWSETGLCVPSVQDTGGRPGRPRLYSVQDVDRVAAVVSLLHEGLSLQRLRRLVAEGKVKLP